MASPRQVTRPKLKSGIQVINFASLVNSNVLRSLWNLSLIDTAAAMSQELNSWQMHPLVIKIPTRKPEEEEQSQLKQNWPHSNTVSLNLDNLEEGRSRLQLVIFISDPPRAENVISGLMGIFITVWRNCGDIGPLQLQGSELFKPLRCHDLRIPNETRSRSQSRGETRQFVSDMSAKFPASANN